MHTRRVLLITGATTPPALRAECAARFDAVHEIPAPRQPADILGFAATVTDYVLGGPEYLGATMLDALPKLRRIALLGTGVPSFIDEGAAAQRAIEVLNTPYMNVESVAEFAVAMMTMTSARAFASAQGVRRGTTWLQGPWRALSESRIGIVGLGHIGHAVARRLRASGAGAIVYANRTRRPEVELALGLVWRPIDALIRECDHVALHVSYSSDTHAMINDDLLAHGHADLSILCFSNPKIIDATAVRKALEQARLGHLYIDGYFREWVENRGVSEDPETLLSLPPERFIATSHLAAQTVGAVDRQLTLALRLLLER